MSLTWKEKIPTVCEFGWRIGKWAPIDAVIRCRPTNNGVINRGLDYFFWKRKNACGPPSPYSIGIFIPKSPRRQSFMSSPLIVILLNAQDIHSATLCLLGFDEPMAMTRSIGGTSVIADSTSPSG
jgi:hypothetical protein